MKPFIIIILLILFTVTCVICQEPAYHYGKLIDNMDSVDVHKEQNDSSDIVAQVKRKEYFLLLSGKDGWSHIITMSNITGYIRENSVNVKGTACGIASIDTGDDDMHTYIYMDVSVLSSAIETVTDGDYVIVLDNSDGDGCDDTNIVLTKSGIKGYIDEKYVRPISIK
ncbi:MAG: hypothetical protein ABRQ39_12140 [Candidatus Eremiobacterota bacterium]